MQRYLTTLTIAATIVVALSNSARASDQAEPQRPPAPCETSYLLPLARMVVVDAAMLAGAALIWPESFSPAAGAGSTAQFSRSWTNAPDYHRAANAFESDGDPWWLNGLLHPIYGSEMYIAARGWGHGPLVAGLFTALSTMIWEYVVEAWFKQPSAIDLFWTPLSGILLGELRYQGWLAAKGGIESPGARRLVMVLLDPLGELERAMLGCPD
jgi:hypothetical protein